MAIASSEASSSADGHVQAMNARRLFPLAMAVLAIPAFIVWGGLALVGIAATTVAYIILISTI